MDIHWWDSGEGGDVGVVLGRDHFCISYVGWYASQIYAWGGGFGHTWVPANTLVIWWVICYFVHVLVRSTGKIFSGRRFFLCCSGGIYSDRRFVFSCGDLCVLFSTSSVRVLLKKIIDSGIWVFDVGICLGIGCLADCIRGLLVKYLREGISSLYWILDFGHLFKGVLVELKDSFLCSSIV